MKKLAIILSVCLVALCSCVDRDFDLGNLSGDVTVGGEELVLPLATLDPVYVEKLLTEGDVVKTNEAGDYLIKYTSYGENPDKYEQFSMGAITIPTIKDLSPVMQPITFSAPELPSELYLSPIKIDFPIDYPSIGSAVDVAKIDVQHELVSGLPISGSGALTEATLAINPDLAKLNITHQDATHFEAEITVLKEIKYVDFVEFGCDKHPFGAPIEIDFDLNGMTDINGGGTLDIKVNFPQGYYLRDESGVDYPLATHNIISKSITVAEKQRSVKVLAYLHKIDYGGRELTNGILPIKDDITYDVALNLALVPGTYNMSAPPKFTILSDPEYKDVEVIIQDFDVAPATTPICYSFNGLNSSITIEKAAFSDAPITLKMTGLEWLDVDMGLELKMPSCMHFDVVSNATMKPSADNTILTTIRQLEQGVALQLKYIDATDTTTCKQENGQLVLDSEAVVSLDLSNLNGHAIMLSRFIPKSPNVHIVVSVAETNLTIDTANSVVKTVSSEAFDFNLEDQLPKLSHTIELPSQLVSVEEVGIRNAADTTKPVSFAFSVAANGASFPVKKLAVDIAVNLGKLLRPTQATLDAGLVQKSENGDYILVVKEDWDTSTAITKVVEFDALQNLPPVVDGEMTISQSFPVTGSVAIKSGENINLSQASTASVKIDIAVDDIKFTTFKGNLDFGMSAEAMSVDLGELSDLKIDIGALTVNPVLKVKVAENTSGIPLYASAKLKLIDAAGNTFSEIESPTAPIAKSGPTTIVLSTPKNEAAYKGEGVTFVAMEELSKILEGGIPAKILADINVVSNKEELNSLDLANIENGVKIDYQYEVLLPLTFDGALNISYESKADGLNATFKEIGSAVNGLTVNDVSLLAEIGTNIPFDMIVTAELINENGTTDGIDAKLNIEECVIKGYTPEYGEQRTSNVVLNFDLGESKSLESLQKVDGLRFKFTICNTEQESATLNKSQFLNGKLKLRLRDGLSIDIVELLGSTTKEE